MVIATLFFLGLSLCIFSGLLCLALAKSVKASRASQLPEGDKVAWNQIKTAIVDLQSRYETVESPKQKALRSWAGTLVICAGLCLIGLVIGADYNNERASLSNILLILMGSDRAAVHSTVPQLPNEHPLQNEQQPKDKPASQPTK